MYIKEFLLLRPQYPYLLYKKCSFKVMINNLSIKINKLWLLYYLFYVNKFIKLNNIQKYKIYNYFNWINKNCKVANILFLNCKIFTKTESTILILSWYTLGAICAYLTASKTRAYTWLTIYRNPIIKESLL